ncbi:hypothetical protein GCM10027187_58680 [Streptosporangium sandarakinum]
MVLLQLAVPSPGLSAGFCRGARVSSVIRMKKLLWVATVAGVAVNLVSNLAAGGELTLVGLAGGVVGVASIAGLIGLYITGRRS